LPKGDAITTAVIGATGRVGSEIVRGLLGRGDAVAALVRDPDKARRAFGEPDGLRIRPTRLDDPRDLSEAFDGICTVFIAMGSIGIEGVLQRIAINAAAGTSSIEQVTRLSVLNASASSLGINQRAHHSIDQFAASTAVPYSTIRPAIFSASLLAAAHEVRSSRTWTGLAGSGRVALIDHRDVAEAGLRVLTDPALWGAHHDLTGPVPMSWPEALEVLSAELGEPVTFRVAAEREFLERLTGAGVPAGTAELLIAREWSILAGENDYTTDTFQQITGRPPRPVAELLHEHRADFM
jgi:NAD(P)H dehydrogenase (quinone)